VYAGEFVAASDGIHGIEVSARRDGKDKQLPNPGPARTNFLVGNLNRESRNAAQNIELLKRIATETNGGYYTADQTSRLIEDITHTDGPASVRETRELWDMPINFLLVVGLAAIEWFIRKRKGLA
jgi:hypothetical protein